MGFSGRVGTKTWVAGSDSRVRALMWAGTWHPPTLSWVPAGSPAVQLRWAGQILTFLVPQTAEKIMDAIDIAVEQISTFSVPHILENHGGVPARRRTDFDVVRATESRR